MTAPKPPRAPPPPPSSSDPGLYRQSSGSFKAEGGSFGRDFRLVVGTILVLTDVGLLYLEHVHAIPPAVYTTPDVIMHIGLLIGGLFLIDPRRLQTLVTSVKEKLPFLGGK